MKKDLHRLRCTACKRTRDEHIWRCTECGKALPIDREGLPIFTDHEHSLFADLACPPALSTLN